MPISEIPVFLALTSISEPQVFIALVVALIPGILAFRLATELYK